MRRVYVTPELSLCQRLIDDDVIMVSVGSGSIAIGGDDWGVKDEF